MKDDHLGPYPSHPVVRAIFRLPILLYRLGLGALVGRLFMIVTTTGRKSGLPRRTAIEFHTYYGRKYVVNGYGMRSDWYRNILADARVTIQTADGVEHCRARRVTDDAELAEAYGFVEANPTFRRFVQVLGVDLSREQFIAHKDRWYLVTFDPTTEPTPPPLAADLWCVLPLAASISVVFALVLGRRGQR
ncbi:nitroreductase family deazaflavin-dependent oxidoreductase [uncultured Chloroflexus sp.]|uniref:nitroreductase family deazaflavin-dependent oxidoreductase n=1 Tax=uncultured Chloroflexus sp. TaxID=214040 RepID=UPI002602409F|nr:nitroreductase family deazaflavin-dependent oxidoreductase [uncultured Chloroflexus sp.]